MAYPKAMQVALNHLIATRRERLDADVARLSVDESLGHE